MALAGETGLDAPASQRAALSKALAWLGAAKPSDIHQDSPEGAHGGLLRQAAQHNASYDRRIASMQRADGGWSQTVPELKSDAFATGQTLYVLSRAGFTAERPKIKRGIDFLVATQMPDGSWPMIFRSTPDGSPGRNYLPRVFCPPILRNALKRITSTAPAPYRHPAPYPSFPDRTTRDQTRSVSVCAWLCWR